MILHHDRHFELLTSLQAWYEKSYWCDRCDKGYEQRYKHICANKCRRCFRVNCEDLTAVPCGDCGLTFRNSECFNEHKNENGGKIPICKNVFKCQQCCKIVTLFNRPKDNPHICGESLCKFCSRFHDLNKHQCFMKVRKLNSKEAEKHRNVACLYFDLETYVGEDGVLVPNLAVSLPPEHVAFFSALALSSFFRSCKMTLDKSGLSRTRINRSELMFLMNSASSCSTSLTKECISSPTIFE